jgi:diguanylate cyclase (GGDEF)-like protein/PAS domain S-box-containing protein
VLSSPELTGWPPAKAGAGAPASTEAATAASAVATELAEALGDVVYAFRVEPDMAFEYISPAVLTLTGYSAEEYYADPSIAVENTAPEHQEVIQAAYGAEEHVLTEFTVPWRHKEGHVIWTHHRCRKAVRPDGSVVVYSAARDVTAQKAAEMALSRSQDQYRLLAENASDVVWRTDLDAIVEWVSPSITSVLGWSPDEFVGSRILDHVHPDDAHRVRSATAAANDGGRVSFEARYLCKDDSYRWLEITARPLIGPNGDVVGKVGSCRDVHSEVEAWHALERSEQRFRLAMESAPTGMAILELDAQFVEVNAALSRMLGHEQDWLLGRDLPSLVHPADEIVCRRMRDDVISGRAASVTEEIRLVSSDHTVVWAQAALALLRDDEGLPRSLVAQFVNVTEAHDSREALRFMATHDPLTQLLNRRELLVRMSMMLAHGRRGRSRMAVLFADLDGLKHANDSYGHSAGDQLIIEASRRIQAQVRDEDLVARIGGDEFVVVLPEVLDLDDALAVADKIIASIGRPLFIAGAEVPIGVSIGVAVARSGDDATTLLRDADAALYRAKEAGRNRIEVHDRALEA